MHFRCDLSKRSETTLFIELVHFRLSDFQLSETQPDLALNYSSRMTVVSWFAVIAMYLLQSNDVGLNLLFFHLHLSGFI